MLFCLRLQGTAKELDRRRLHAMALLDEGMPGVEVANAFAATPGAISQWKARYRRACRVSLMAKPHPGPEPKLTAQQRRRLERMLVQRAHKHGDSIELWNLKRIGELIGRHFGVACEQSGVWRLLRSMGWSCKNSECRARERNEEAIAPWRQNDWPRTKKNAAKWSCHSGRVLTRTCKESMSMALTVADPQYRSRRNQESLFYCGEIPNRR